MDEDKKDEKLNNDNGLEECKKQAEEYLNNWKRERADFINYKKDEAKRMEEFLKFSTEGVILEFIDVIDGIEVARNNLPDRQVGLPESKELKEWTEGFDSALDKLESFLKKFGVEKVKVNGGPSTHSTKPQGGEPVESTGSGQVKFDPLLHEAVTIETQNGNGNTEEKIEEIRPGYTMHGKVIRPARVKIIQ
ncbi:MAG: nucleotide exchange factor GrpE [bacterium]|nr:nucleotide exchange factor GrpE [bacterium]